MHEVHAAHGSLSRGSRDALAPYKTAPRPRISRCHPLSRSTTSAVVVNRQRTSACAFHSKSGRGLKFCVREMRKAFSRVVCYSLLSLGCHESFLERKRAEREYSYPCTHRRAASRLHRPDAPSTTVLTLQVGAHELSMSPLCTV